MPQLLTVEGTYNVRDLGSFAVGTNSATRNRRLIRAGNLDQLSLLAQQQLIAYGVKTVIDLRDEWETQQFPNVFAQFTTVKYLSLPLIGNQLSNNESWKTENENFTLLHELYIKYLEHCKMQIGTIISTIADSEAAIVVHCYAGKDRTGIITALVLGAVGVSDDLIAEDYAQSKSQIMHLIEQWREYALQHNRDMQRLERDSGSEPITILSVLDYAKLHYGSVSDYLRACGVTDRQLTRLTSLLVEPND
jgi:protein-tyrosine phosphatase